MISLVPVKYADFFGSLTAPKYNPYKLPESLVDFLPMCKIRTGSGIKDFIPFNYQSKLAEIIQRHEKIVIYKDRQIGVSELLVALCYWQTALDPSWLAAYISITKDKTTEAKDRAKTLNPLPSAKFINDRTSKMQLQKGGATNYLTGSPSAARGLAAVNTVILDEGAFIQHWDEIYAAASNCQNSVPVDRRKMIIATTVGINGIANPTYKIFADGAENKNRPRELVDMAKGGETNCDTPGMTYWVDDAGVAKVVVSHKAHPIYGQDPEYLNKIHKTTRQPWPIILRENDLGLDAATDCLFRFGIKLVGGGKWLDRPDEDGIYAAFLDPNFGGDDAWSLQIWDIKALWDGGKFLLVAEDNASLRSTTNSTERMWDMIDQYGCKCLIYEGNSGGVVLGENFAKERPGFPAIEVLTTGASKIPMTDRAAYYCEQGVVCVPDDWEGIEEMQQFSTSKREAITGHDDRVMAMSVGFSQLEAIADALAIGVVQGGFIS